MCKINYFSLCLICLQILSYAGTIRLSGIVQDEFNMQIAGAEIYLHTRNNLRTITDENGYFELTGNSDTTSTLNKIQHFRHIVLNRSVLNINGSPGSQIQICMYDFKGRKINEIESGLNVTGDKKFEFPVIGLASGTYLVSVNVDGNTTVIRYVVSEKGFYPGKIYSDNKKDVSARIAQTLEFNDILVVSANGTQAHRRPVTSIEESDIKIKLMPSGVGYVTPGIPVFTEKGGKGDVTTYGSVSDPEFSQGGACNYGSTGISYYAAINVNQIPGDLKGQWQGGQICGRCAKVLIRTKAGEVRTTIVRIMDKCADDNCGIDLGGAPAGEIMKTEPGRYCGEWEWVNCDGVEGVSDGPAALFIKAGSNQFWSLVQVRNGPGAVAQIWVRKMGNSEWQSLPWATEAENYFRLPLELLQDNEEWEVEVLWQSGTTSYLRLSGNKLALENTSYPLES